MAFSRGETGACFYMNSLLFSPLLLAALVAACKPASAGSHTEILPAGPVARHAGPAARDTVRLGGLTGTFHAVRSPRPHGEQFELSLDRGPGREERFVVGIARYGAGRPEVGRYPLALLNRENPAGRFYAAYHAKSGEASRSYVSVDGELVITASSPERVAGRFRFRGAEYSASSPRERRGSGSPSSVAPDAPTIEVVGTFTSTRLNEREMVACVGTGGPSVMVEVRDPEGRPAAFGTTIVIQEGAFRDSVDGAHPVSQLHVGAGERRPGTYQVRLYKPGYKPVVLHNVQAPPTGHPRCKYAEPTDIRQVTLTLLPNAPRVRSIIVTPPGMGLGIPGYETPMRAIVDAAPGVSQAVRWTSSDTTVATVSASGVLRSQCRRTPGQATITATSVVDPRVRGTASVTVYAMRPGDERGIAPASARAKVEACLARLGKPQ